MSRQAALSLTETESKSESGEPTLGGMVLVHHLTIVTASKLDLTVAVLQAVARTGFRLTALRMIERPGGRSEHRLVLTGASPAAARALTRDILSLAGSVSAATEHEFRRA